MVVARTNWLGVQWFVPACPPQPVNFWFGAIFKPLFDTRLPLEKKLLIHTGSIMKQYAKQEQRLMATWAADCAERVLPLFEQAYPEDDRPRKAIEICRAWVRTGVFQMADIRGTSLAAPAAARTAKENTVAYFSARATGQAVATAHVPQHAFGSACMGNFNQ